MARRRKTAENASDTAPTPKASRAKKKAKKTGPSSKEVTRAKAKEIAESVLAMEDEAIRAEVKQTDEYSARRTRKEVVQHTKQRTTIEQMLAHNVHTSDIVEEMTTNPEFMMNAKTVRNIIFRCRRRWRETDVELRGDYKLAAQKRILGSIAEARKAGNYGAVASLEKLLSDIQGTKEPERVKIDINATLRSSVEVSLALMTPDQIRGYAQDFRQRRKRLGVERNKRLPRKVTDSDGVIEG